MNNYIFEKRFSTPPGRAAAFEEFKQTRGSNLNKIYLENKEIMTTKKKQFAELARRVNQAKAEIDKTRIDAERKKNERLTMGNRIISFYFFIDFR
jgi:kinesin family protein 6/9